MDKLRDDSLIQPVAQANRHHSSLPLLTEAAVAKLLGVSPQYLVKWRFVGRPVLPFVRMGRRAIRYCMSDIEEFIRRNKVGVGP